MSLARSFGSFNMDDAAIEFLCAFHSPFIALKATSQPPDIFSCSFCDHLTHKHRPKLSRLVLTNPACALGADLHEAVRDLMSWEHYMELCNLEAEM
ncbi:hypothetical protein EDD15DRAFT_2363297 [Pisolithus albus]|nr:hypothetical protein EDD15DRAFT_2363297 [Pisolithus albus]